MVRNNDADSVDFFLSFERKQNFNKWWSLNVWTCTDVVNILKSVEKLLIIFMNNNVRIVDVVV